MRLSARIGEYYNRRKEGAQNNNTFRGSGNIQMSWGSAFGEFIQGQLQSNVYAHLNTVIPANDFEAHGSVVTRNQKYVHTFDRVQAQAYVINTSTKTGRFSYSLQDSHVCKAFSVTDNSNLPWNDPSPDLVETTSNGKFLAVGFCVPAPVTFSHTTQGSCPGVGIVQLLENDKVLRTTDITPNNITKPSAISGGVNYRERTH